MKEDKRKVPSLLQNVLAIDKEVTEKFVKFVESFPPMRSLQLHYTLLEISCHGIVWFVMLIASIWIFNSHSLYQLQINLLIGLLLDVIIVGVLKAITRRRRPFSNDSNTLGPDKYSFPSGHASRAILIFYFFNYLWSISIIFFLPLSAWVISIALSRLLMRRHHILDVVVGLLLGYAEGIVMSILYLTPETCTNIVSWMTDEKMDGGEYHV